MRNSTKWYYRMSAIHHKDKQISFKIRNKFVQADTGLTSYCKAFIRNKTIEVQAAAGCITSRKAHGSPSSSFTSKW
jgi:hypothetical protein